jgi:hypothetical protein
VTTLARRGRLPVRPCDHPAGITSRPARQFGGQPLTNIRNVASPHRRLARNQESVSRARDQLLRVRRHEVPQDPDMIRAGRGSAALRLCGLVDPLAGVRGPKSAPIEGEHELFGFLTTEANAIVAPIHPKAMPVIWARSDARPRPIFYSLPRRRCYPQHGVDRPASRHAALPASTSSQRSMEARPCSSQ